MTGIAVPACAAVRCPVCRRVLGIRDGQLLYQRLHAGGGLVRIVESPAEATRIQCDRTRGCPGVWTAQERAA